jgi:hypothetical protein
MQIIAEKRVVEVKDMGANPERADRVGGQTSLIMVLGAVADQLKETLREGVRQLDGLRARDSWSENDRRASINVCHALNNGPIARMARNHS